MDADLSAYACVTPELEEAEHQAFLECLAGASADDRATGLAWLEQFQGFRSLMAMLMGGLIEVAVEDGEVGFRLAAQGSPELIDRLERAGLLEDDKGATDDQQTN